MKSNRIDGNMYKVSILYLSRCIYGWRECNTYRFEFFFKQKIMIVCCAFFNIKCKLLTLKLKYDPMLNHPSTSICYLILWMYLVQRKQIRMPNNFKYLIITFKLQTTSTSGFKDQKYIKLMQLNVLLNFDTKACIQICTGFIMKWTEI